MVLTKIFNLPYTGLDGLHFVGNWALWFNLPSPAQWFVEAQPGHLAERGSAQNQPAVSDNVYIELWGYGADWTYIIEARPSTHVWFTDHRLFLIPASLSGAATPSWEWVAWQEVKSRTLWEGQHELQPQLRGDQSSALEGKVKQHGLRKYSLSSGWQLKDILYFYWRYLPFQPDQKLQPFSDKTGTSL